MLKLKTTDIPPSVDLVLKHINEDTAKNGVFIDLDNVQYNYYWAFKNYKDCLVKLKLLGVSDTSPTTIKKFIRDKKIEELFYKTPGDDISLSAESIEHFQSECTNEGFKEIFKLISESKTYGTVMSNMRGKETSYMFSPIVQYVSMSRHRMGVVNPIYNAQNTGRFAASKPAIQNISKDIPKPIITVPYGYYMFEVDSGQIDPRWYENFILRDDQIAYLVNLYNDAYFGYLHYCMLTDEQRASGTLDIQKMEITEELKAHRQKLKGICNGSMYGKTNITDKNDRLEIAYITYIGGHKNKKRLEEEIKQQLGTGNTIFKTPFGTPIDVSKTDDRTIAKYNSDSYENVFQGRFRKALNGPIQGASADCVRFAYENLRNYFKEVSPGSSIITVTHDSIKGCVPKQDYEKVKDVVNDCVSYEIEGYPIKVYSEATWKFE